MTINILLADDHAMIREGLQMVIETQKDLHVVGLAADGLEAVSLAERLKPDLVIVDIQMPGLSGFDVVRQIKQRLPQCRVIVLSMYDEEEYVLGVLRDGASGYVLKESSADNLVAAVRVVMAGGRYLSPRLAERALNSYISQTRLGPAGDEYTTLTNREREVLHLAAEGLNGPEIARRLSISPRTVEAHRANLMRKLDLHSLAELIQYARQKKILPELPRVSGELPDA